MSCKEEGKPRNEKGNVADALSGESIHPDGTGTEELTPPIGYELVDWEINPTMRQLFRSMGFTFREDGG